MADILRFPVYLAEGAAGVCVMASTDLDAAVQVAEFDGQTLESYDLVPDSEARYAIGLYLGGWLIPETDARYLNHSCDANCRIGDELEVFTVRPVRAGEELTISYDRADPEEYASRPETYFWDPRWNFECRCGAPLCRGRIDRYVVVSGAQS